jgi:hypothetical protein
MTTTASTTMDLSDLLQAGIRYGTIFTDPPWPERGSGRIKRGADRYYPLMKIADIIGMAPAVRQIAKPRSHLSQAHLARPRPANGLAGADEVHSSTGC